MINIICEFQLTDEQKEKIINYANANKEQEGEISEIVVTKDIDNKINLEIAFKQDKKPIKRIRRITGYLSGDLSTWNNAKRAEERERVEHIVSEN